MTLKETYSGRPSPADHSQAMAMPNNVAELRASYKRYQLLMLRIVLSLIFAVSTALWLVDGASTVAAGYYVLLIHPVWGLIIHLIVSLFQSHLLNIKSLVEEMFGKGAKIASWLATLIGGATTLSGLLNVGAGTLGGLYLLWSKGYTIFGAAPGWIASLFGVETSVRFGPAVVCTLAAVIISNSERAMVWSWLALRWLKKNRR